MANNLSQPQVAANDTGHKVTAQSTMQEYQNLKTGSDTIAQSSKAIQERTKALAKYFQSGAKQQEQQAKTLATSGSIKMATGFALIGTAAALMAIPLIGPEVALPMMADGATQIGLGAVDSAQAKQLRGMAAQALEEATNHEITSKEEGQTVNREKNRSQMYERKLELLKQMLDEAGIQNENLSEKDLEKLKEGITNNFDKFFEDAGRTLLNNGVMSIDGLQNPDGSKLGTQFFIRDEDSGKFYNVEVPRDEKGNPIQGADGKPLIDTARDITEVEDGQVKDLLKLKFRFVDELKNMASGMDIGVADANGNLRLRPYDLENEDDLKDLVDLNFKTNMGKIKSGQLAAPLKFVNLGGEPALQPWDWEKNVPTGNAVTFNEIGGGKVNRGNIEDYQLAIERSQNSLKALGLGTGGARFKLSGSVEDHSSPSIASRTDTSGDRNGSGFASFLQSTTGTINAIRSSQDSILDSNNLSDQTSGGRG